MKYRVKQVGGRFYPQYRLFFIWHGIVDANDYWTRTVNFDNLKEAKEFVEFDKAGKNKKTKKVYEL